MKILEGQNLVNQLRTISEKVKKRLWIVVPYIGSPTTIRKILGKEWFDRPSVSVRLLTDTSDLSCIDAEALQNFYNRGQVRTILGLHAKIYIIDDQCIITSANLTNTAFSKRHEIGVLLTSNETKDVLETFNNWWKKAENISPSKLTKIFTTKNVSKEEKGIAMPKLFDLPNDPGSFIKNPSNKFLQYDRLFDDYVDFSKKYESIQRIWKSQPLFFEVDGFLDYLYSKEKTPSKKYDTAKPKKITDNEQLIQLKKWTAEFKVWASKQENNEWRVNNSKIIKENLAPNKIMSLKKEEIKQTLLCTNAGNSRRGNCNTAINENKLSDVRLAINILVNEHNLTLPQRFNTCSQIKGIGPSIMNELLGFCYPDIYPLINKRSNSGLKFFGYQIKAYN
jgi:hypothetical protein